jgi:hypothetical protein
MVPAAEEIPMIGDPETRNALFLPGAALGLLAILYGFGLGIAFGAAEEALKSRLKASAEAARPTYLARAEREPDPEAAARADAAKVVEKSWTYLQRAHLHAGALGTVALLVTLLLGGLPAWRAARSLASVSLGLGALAYPLFWMLAAFRAPELGSTSAAKDSLQWLAILGSGLCVLGAVLALLLVVGEIARRSRTAA